VARFARRLAALLVLLGLALPAVAHSELEGTVTRVVDGDTIYVDVGGRVERVRYIGVNTPEMNHPRRGQERGGRAAAAINSELVRGRRVRLELDAQARDRHGRLLAYVWVADTMVNAELVRRGFAQVMTVPPNVRHQSLFVKLQREARTAGRGLWADPAPTVR
jgi:micrococcal nuclease